MTSFSTSSALNTLFRYDSNEDGLSRNELFQAEMENFFNMTRGAIENNPDQFYNSLSGYVASSQMLHNFDALSKASGNVMPDNPTTISGFDIIKTAANDGNVMNISQNDICQEQYGNNYNYFAGMQSPYYSQPVTNPVNYSNNYYNYNFGYNYQTPSATNDSQENFSMGGAAKGAGIATLAALAIPGAAPYLLPMMIGGTLLGSGLAGSILKGAGNFIEKGG